MASKDEDIQMEIGQKPGSSASRNIGHLCHDEPISQRQKKKIQNSKEGSLEPKTDSSQTPPIQTAPTIQASAQASSSSDLHHHHHLEQQQQPSQIQPQVEIQSVPQHLQQQLYVSGESQKKPERPIDPLNQNPYNQQPFFFSEHAAIVAVILVLVIRLYSTPPSLNNQITTSHSLTNLSLTNLSMLNSPITGTTPTGNNNGQIPLIAYQQHSSVASNHQQVSDSARDKFFLTAADPSTEISPEERLKQVINAKLEAGLLQPYNYAKGYARLQSYMDNYMNQSSKQRILKPLSIFRPAFRAIARTLKDVDLILVEENFERMLLDYDRVFTSMAIPACLWRRTGEIYRGNKEFASLVEVNADDLRDGKLAIYELMSEESAVNFWEKYGAIAFDKGQKAVLTSCNLRTRDGRRRKTCCFSFTIRRDRYNIPSCIVGNFIPISP
ncbi:unnamed protein product [Wickerhamomyces anomalus]